LAGSADNLILVGGEALYDLVVEGDDQLRAHPGGAAFNAARTIARLGEPVAYLGRLSSDRFGARLRQMLADDGVLLDAVVDTDDPTTLALAEVDPSGSAVYRFYERATSAPGLTPDAALAALPRDVGLLHVGTLGLLLDPMASALEAVVDELAGRALIAVDPNVRPGAVADPGAYRDRQDRVLARSWLLYTSPSPRYRSQTRMPSSA
jgi:fructokinase